jgi:hypothetical protein
MTNKKLNLLFAGVFAAVFLIGLASATITLNPSISTLPQTSGSFNLTVSSDQNETINLNVPSLSDSSGRSIIFALSPSSVTINTASSPSHVVNVSYVVQSGFNFEFLNKYNANLIASGGLSGEISNMIPFVASNFCEVDNKGSLSTSIENVDVIGSNTFGSNNEWYPFDQVQFDVRVRNRGSEDINSISLEWGLYDVQSKTWAIGVAEEDNFDLNNGDDQTTTITFTLDNNMDENLQDLKKGDYIIYARATGDISGGTNDGVSTCSSDSNTGKLVIDKNFVILNNLQVPSVVQCDSDFQISGTAWNIGSSNQKSVYVQVYNKDLGINNVNIDIGDVNSLDSSDFDQLLTLPADLQEKNYTLTLTVYDKNDKVYSNGNKDKSVFTLPLKVQGNCFVAKASVVALLQSGGQAGKPLVVKATITNTGNKVATYALSATDYTNWASSATLDKSSLTLNAGESGDVLLTFNVNKAALGTNLFTLDVLSENQQIVSQPIQVEITKSKGLFGNLFSGSNAYIWGIGILNLILIILIIVIAVRIARK